jgi:hypothetical protein
MKYKMMFFVAVAGLCLGVFSTPQPAVAWYCEDNVCNEATEECEYWDESLLRFNCNMLPGGGCETKLCDE